MMKCKICDKDLYMNISFSNLFRINYYVHDKCHNSLVINSDRLVFPVNNNLIYYDYVFYEVNSEYNHEYLEGEYLSILFKRNFTNIDWSIIIYHDEKLFEGLNQSELVVLFSLSKLPVLIVSLIYYDLSNKFYENI